MILRITKSKKGFVAFEAIIIIFIIFVLFIGTYAVYKQKARQLILSKQEIDQRSDCLQLANAITSMTMVRGAIMNMTSYHNMIIEPDQQRITSELSICTFPVKNVRNESGSSSRFQINAGRITVTNQNNGIIIANT